MKSYYFISGLPRSGSTLLSAVLRQNPNFYADIASAVESLTDMSIDLITNDKINFSIDKNQRKNLMYGIFDGYYKHVEKPIIFDTCRKWTRKTNFLQELFPYTKILCPVRDIVSILNSFETIFSKNPFYATTLTKNNHNVFARCDELMNVDNGMIFSPWIALQEGYAINSKMIYFVEYDVLCKEPEKTMKKIYEFLELPYYSHDFENIKYSNENFDRACNLKDFHTVKKRVEYNPTKYILPLKIIKKYQEMNMEFWKTNHESDKQRIEYK